MPEATGTSTEALEMVLYHLHNFFAMKGEARTGEHRIASGALTDADYLTDGQYYIIAGSLFNDGLHKRGEGALLPETFAGTVAPCAVPRAVVTLAGEIDAWRANNPETDKQSESFGGYSFSRGSTQGAASGWAAAFAARLAPWRRPYDDI